MNRSKRSKIIKKKKGFERGANKPHMVLLDGKLYAFVRCYDGHGYHLAHIHDDERNKNIAAIIRTYGMWVTERDLRYRGLLQW